MEFVGNFQKILDRADKELELLKKAERPVFKGQDIGPAKSGNIFYQADNLLAMIDLLDRGYGDSFDLIYIDPPFFTRKTFTNRIPFFSKGKKIFLDFWAYDDSWKDGLDSYLTMLAKSFLLIRELLSEKGSLYVHLDFRTVHYVKLLLDGIFGSDRMVNEIIWSYKSGGSCKRHFARKHDSILLYSKTDSYIFNPQKEKSYNRGLKPYRFKGVEEYEDHIGWYTLVNQRDVWELSVLGRTSGERQGYGTQKPEELLERIVRASSNEGSLVGDFFAGSGSLAAVADRLGRDWIVADLGQMSSLTIRRRLAQQAVGGYAFYYLNEANFSKKNTLEFKLLCEDKKEVSISLQKFNLDFDDLDLDELKKESLEEIYEEDSLALIDYLALTYVQEGRLNLQEIWTRDRESLTMDRELKPKEDIREGAYLYYVDVFGRSYINPISTC